MKKPKTPRKLLNELQKLNPHASPTEIKDLLFGEMLKDPEYFEAMMFDDLFADFKRETGYRGSSQDGLDQFMAWLNKPKN
jgi:hypothetical protein